LEPDHVSVFGREASGNVAENLLRDFEDKWWKASREVGMELGRQPSVHQIQFTPQVHGLPSVVDDMHRVMRKRSGRCWGAGGGC
jgi:hypothetical protein